MSSYAGSDINDLMPQHVGACSPKLGFSEGGGRTAIKIMGKYKEIQPGSKSTC